MKESITIEEIKRKFEEKNIPSSYHRLKIYQYLYGNHTHPTVEKIYKDLSREIPTLSKTTIYTTLKLLVNKRMIKEITIDENEMRYDCNVEPHAHFKCTVCGRVYDIQLENPIFEMREVEGHTIKDTCVYFRGVCNNCLRESSNKN